MILLPSIRDLTKRCGARTGCAGVFFDLWPGRVPCVVGESGSGKATLLGCLAGHLAPDAGTVVPDTRAERPRDVPAMAEPERRMPACTDRPSSIPFPPCCPTNPRPASTPPSARSSRP